MSTRCIVVQLSLLLAVAGCGRVPSTTPTPTSPATHPTLSTAKYQDACVEVVNHARNTTTNLPISDDWRCTWDYNGQRDCAISWKYRGVVDGADEYLFRVEGPLMDQHEQKEFTVRYAGSATHVVQSAQLKVVLRPER